jgi:hypothetical protein
VVVDDARYDHMLARADGRVIAALAAPYRAIVAAATTTART